VRKSTEKKGRKLERKPHQLGGRSPKAAKTQRQIIKGEKGEHEKWRWTRVTGGIR